MTEDEAILQLLEKQLRIAMERVTEMEEAIAKHKQSMAKKAAQQIAQADGEPVCKICSSPAVRPNGYCAVCDD